MSEEWYKNRDYSWWKKFRKQTKTLLKLWSLPGQKATFKRDNNARRVAVSWCSSKPWTIEPNITCSACMLCSAAHVILENQLTVACLTLVRIPLRTTVDTYLRYQDMTCVWGDFLKHLVVDFHLTCCLTNLALLAFSYAQKACLRSFELHSD